MEAIASNLHLKTVFCPPSQYCQHMTCKQVVLTTEYAEAWQPRLSELPHVSVVSYNISVHDELAIRQQIRATQRAVGLSGLRDIFGLPKHSEPLLQDTELHRKIRVCVHEAASVTIGCNCVLQTQCDIAHIQKVKMRLGRGLCCN